MNLRKKIHENEPYVADVEMMSERNPYFRTAIWTGDHVQMTLMSIPILGEIGEEIHPDTDQIIRVEHGIGMLEVGKENADKMETESQQVINKGDVVFIPSGTWHNIKNKGRRALKLSSIYAPPHHPADTIHRTREEAEAADKA